VLLVLWDSRAFKAFKVRLETLEPRGFKDRLDFKALWDKLVPWDSKARPALLVFRESKALKARRVLLVP
jgi:hypothetical protein